MPFILIKGNYHIDGYSPDGDSIRFEADDPANWTRLASPPVALNGRHHAQLRLEGIDTLETHYQGFHKAACTGPDRHHFPFIAAGSIAGFKEFLESRPDPVLVLPTGHFTNLDTFVVVFEGCVTLMIEPENLVRVE